MQDPLSQKQDENKTNIFRIVLLISILISLTIYVKAPINQYDHITDQQISMNKYKKVENGLEMPIMTTLHHHQYKAAEQIRKDKEQRLVHLSQNALVKNAVNDKGEYSEENNQKKCREKLNVLLCMWKPYTDLFAPEINLQYVDVNEQNMTPDQKKEQEAHPKKVLTDYEGIKNINISNNIKDFNFTIHLIPHSHQDLGWQLTLSQYYNFKVKYIFKNLWQALSDDPKKTFVMDNIGYLKAYLDDQKNTKEYPQIIKKLQDWLIEGRVEITNISISSPDEAITYYKDLLSNIRSGVHWINTEILKGLDSDQIQKIKNQNFKNAWYIDAFGHSSTTMKLLSQLGYNSVTWARMNTQQLDYRRKNKKLIFDWISETQNKDFQVEDKLRVITFPFHYHTFFSFDVFSPFSLNPMTEEFYLSMQNFKLFAKEMQFLSQEFAGNVAMLPVGEDFAFVNPQPVFTRIEFYIIIIESNKEKKSVMEKCKVQFSTINRFLNDVQQNYNSTWETYKENPKIGGDFLPLKEKENHRSWHDAVWSGYFATRQNFKLKIAEFSRFLNTVTNLYMSRVKFIEKTWEDYKVWQKELQDLIEEGEFIRGVMTHHDAVTGTSLELVNQDYTLMMENIKTKIINKLLDVENSQNRRIFEKLTKDFFGFKYDFKIPQISQLDDKPLKKPEEKPQNKNYEIVDSSPIKITEKPTYETCSKICTFSKKADTTKGEYLQEKSEKFRDFIEKEKRESEESEKKIIKILNSGPDITYFDLQVEGIDLSRYKLTNQAEQILPSNVLCWSGLKNNGSDCIWTFTIPLVPGQSITEYLLEKGGKVGYLDNQDILQGVINYKNVLVNNSDAKNNVKNEKKEESSENTNSEESGLTAKKTVNKSNAYSQEAHVFLDDHNIMVHFIITESGKLQLNLENGFKLKIGYLHYMAENLMKNQAAGSYIFNLKSGERKSYPVVLSHLLVQNHKHFYILLVQNSEKNFNLEIKLNKYISELNHLEINHYVTADINKYSWMNNSEFFVSYETELINNGIFFTDSNGLELMRRQFMERDFDYNSDTVSLSTNLYPITAIAMIKDQFNGLEVGVVVDRPNFVTSHHEGQLMVGLTRLNEGIDQKSMPNPVSEWVFEKDNLQVYQTHNLVFGLNIEHQLRSLQIKRDIKPIISMIDVNNVAYNGIGLEKSNRYLFQGELENNVTVDFTLVDNQYFVTLSNINSYVEVHVEDLHAKIWLHFNYDKEIVEQRQKNPYYFGEKNVGLVYVGLDYREIKKGGASRVLNGGEEPLSSKNLQADRCLFYVKKVGDEDIGVEKNKGVKKEDFQSKNEKRFEKLKVLPLSMCCFKILLD